MWIPRQVLEDDELSADEKLLYADMASFNECYMLNSTFAKRYGCSERTIQDRLKKLKDKGYIFQSGFDGRKRYLQVAHIAVYSQDNATKLRGRHAESRTSGVQNLAPIDNSERTDNIYIPIKEKTNLEHSDNLTSVNTIPPYTTAPVNEDGEVIKKPVKKPKPQYGNATLSVLGMFNRLVQEHVGVDAPTGQKYFFIVQSTAKKHNFSTDDFKELFDYFFSDNLSPEMKTSLQLVCSDSYITKWKARKANKPITQLEAAEGIRL